MSLKPLEEVKEADDVGLEYSIPKKREQSSAEMLKEALEDELEELDDEMIAEPSTPGFNLKIEAKMQNQ